ncbi:ATP-binding cassette domain-containing protein [Dactylosporangium sucinum]|uniref:ABC transporter ATP-binding protein n=1 Tax=Dactylosporangium sucinum TaxID=1424081 RepID=A0A917WXE3_9ACTN|nr:ATP-binding cassette domain-containing protein [Dactylosporangium sucinum]GGM36892.1 ABC transporter ATP-binding protein [Dactylosporangium sucinum]
MTAQQSSSLRLDNVTVKFGGLTVLNRLSVEFGAAPISSLIGPNGAGKTTVFNVFSGLVKPTEGRVLFQGRDITGASPVSIARMGIIRKFQVPTVFPGLSVGDNLKVAARAPRQRHEPGDGDGWAIDDVTDLLQLSGKKQRPAAELSHGERQWLEIGMAFLGRPKFLLLDEPAAGLGPDESEHTARLIKEISAHCAAVVIEHDMSFIRSLGGHIIVLHQGAVLRQGTMEDIEDDAVVRDIYLGRNTHA